MNLRKKSKILVGCAQINSVLGDIQSNVEKHIVSIKEAKANDCDLLVFPELSLTGYRMDDYGRSLAVSIDSDVLNQIAIEVDKSISVVIGFVEEGPCGLVYNSAALLNDSKVCFVHRKMSLPTFGRLDEGKYFAEGRTVQLYNLSSEWTLSSLICQDVWQPSLVHVAAMKGATLFVSPFCSAIGGIGENYDNAAGWEITSKYISMTYGMPSIMCNRVGKEKDFEYWGGSSIVGPYGNILTKAGADEELILAQLDYMDVQDARYSLPIVRDCRIDTTIRELQKAAAGDFGE
ncbi:MAG: nitrilase-related carbon-nitrogen hydrolase [Arenicella sp.]